MIGRNLVRRYPVGLGVVEVSPMEMARAFSVFANRGVAVEPLAVRYIEDRDGKVILEPAREQQRVLLQNPNRILSEESAYIMTNLLKTTTSNGTLSYAVSNAGKPAGIDIAGKTGTTQNWADAWTVGFTPYITTAVWVGFDRGGFNSLGTNQTGAVTAGPIWAKFMRDAHQNLAPRQFVAPNSGISYQQVTAQSGLLPPSGYEGRVINEIFLSGTEPSEYDFNFRFEQEQRRRFEERIQDSLFSRVSDNQFGIEFDSDVLERSDAETPDIEPSIDSQSLDVERRINIFETPDVEARIDIEQRVINSDN